MDKLIEIQNIKILENLNRPINSKEIESVIKNLLTKKSLDWMTSLVNKFKCHTFKQLTLILLKLFQKLKRREHILTHPMRLS